MRLAFELLDAASGDSIGELTQASQRSIQLPLSKPRLGGFTVRRDNPLLPYILQADLTLVSVVQDPPQVSTDPPGARRILGPICSFDRSADATGGSVAVVFGGPEVRLGGRLIGKSKTGVLYPLSGALIGDKTDVMWQVVTDCRSVATSLNAGVASFGDVDHGLRKGNVTNGGTPDGFYGPSYYKDGLTALAELATPLDGIDWIVRPVATDPLAPDSQGLPLGLMDMAPTIGQRRPDVIYEYGTGKRNVATLRHTGVAVGSPGQGQTGLCNIAYALPPGFPDNATQGVLAAADFPSSAAHGAWEAVATSDVTADALRQKLVDNAVRVRRYPTQAITFTPTVDPGDGSAYVYGVDYVEGDVIEFRAVEEGTVTVDGLFRIYQVTFTADNLGMVTPTFVLVNDGTY